ncbi:MAG: hypothetical protein ACO1SV_15465 [Fimbriimonas sp.]
MPIPLLFAALVLGQEPAQTPVSSPATPETSFQTPFVIAEPNRLALTPKLDGELSVEEWDPLVSTEGLKGFFQWEPGQLHLAATAPNGQDLLLSLDLRSNGWLVGADNVEIRVTNRDGSARVMARLVDATNVAGPTWVDLPGIGMAATISAKAGEAETTYEVTLSDANLGLFPTSDGKGLSVRLDTVPSEAAPLEPYIPRTLAPVTLVYRRAAAVPNGLKWGIEGAGNSTTPGGSIRIRYTFNGDEKLGLKKLALRSEGVVKDETTQSTVPFPVFDNKKRAFVDYETKIRPETATGWRISRGELEAGDGLTALIQASYRIAPTVDIELVRENVKSLPRDQRVKLTYFVRSNSTRRVDGNVSITPPREFHMITGKDKGFTIYNSKGSARRVIEMDVPANTQGVFPILIRTEIGGQVLEKTVYLNIQ